MLYQMCTIDIFIFFNEMSITAKLKWNVKF